MALCLSAWVQACRVCEEKEAEYAAIRKGVVAKKKRYRVTTVAPVSTWLGYLENVTSALAKFPTQLKPIIASAPFSTGMA